MNQIFEVIKISSDNINYYHKEVLKSLYLSAIIHIYQCNKVHNNMDVCDKMIDLFDYFTNYDNIDKYQDISDKIGLFNFNIHTEYKCDTIYASNILEPLLTKIEVSPSNNKDKILAFFSLPKFDEKDPTKVNYLTTISQTAGMLNHKFKSIIKGQMRCNNLHLGLVKDKDNDIIMMMGIFPSDKFYIQYHMYIYRTLTSEYKSFLTGIKFPNISIALHSYCAAFMQKEYKKLIAVLSKPIGDMQKIFLDSGINGVITDIDYFYDFELKTLKNLGDGFTGCGGHNGHEQIIIFATPELTQYYLKFTEQQGGSSDKLKYKKYKNKYLLLKNHK